MRTLAQRRRLLQDARLYFVTDAAVDDAIVEAALDGGVDVVQLRDRSLSDDAVVAVGSRWAALCERRDALLFVNDRPDLALQARADGVHVGQDDVSVALARERSAAQLLVGLSTHSRDQLTAGLAAGADQLSVGPIWETPTKPGRPATGLELVREVAGLAPSIPWFAIGGIDASNVATVAAAGAARCVVVRAIRDAADPFGAARQLRGALEEVSLAA